MSFKDTLRKNLTPELYTQVLDQLGDDFDYDLVPRTRLNQVINQRNELRAQLAGNSQPQGTDEDKDGVVPPKAKDNSEDIAQLKAKYDKSIQDVKIQYAALEQLRASHVIDPELVWSSNALDKSKISLDATGALTGLTEQLTQLQQSKAHLFCIESKQDNVPAGTGKNEGGAPEEVTTTKEDFLKLDMDKQIAFKQAHPEVFKQFMSSN